MSTSGKMLVSVGEKCACIQIIGKANCATSPDFQALFNDLWKKGCTHYILDLAGCTFMDSTFLGILAWAGLKVNPSTPVNPERIVELYNPTATISELIENLGVLHLFKVTQGQVILADVSETHDLTPARPTSEECKRTSLAAHELLVQINPANAGKFKDVVAFLTEDLKKLTEAQRPPSNAE